MSMLRTVSETIEVTLAETDDPCVATPSLVMQDES